MKPLVFALALSSAPLIHAQGCAMCNTNAAQQEAHQRKALDRAILVLGVPAFLFLSGLGVAAYRHRDR